MDAERPSTMGKPRISAVVRPARKADVAQLSAFFTRAWHEAGPGALGFTGATDEAIKTISSEEFLTRRISSPNIRVVIAESNGEILGFASVKVVGGGEGELAGIVVLESATGMGLGTKLMRKACEAAQKLGLRQLVVKTETSNKRATAFYKKNKFTESGKTLTKVGRVKVPLLVLEKKLRSSSSLPTAHRPQK